MPNNIFILILLFSLSNIISKATSLDERYKNADLYQQYSQDCYLSHVSPQWIDNTDSFIYVQDKKGVKKFFLVDMGKKEQHLAFSHETLAKELEILLKRPISPTRLPFQEITVLSSPKIAQFSVDNRQFSLTLSTGKVTEILAKAPIASSQHKPEAGIPSFNKKYTALIENNNVHLKNITTGKLTPLTTDGTPDVSYHYPLEWAPDSLHFVCFKSTKVQQQTVTLIESSPKNQLQPKVTTIPYAKPGDPMPITHPILFDIQKETKIKINFPHAEHQFKLSHLRWETGGAAFTFDANRRGHSEYIVYRVDKTTSTAIPLIIESTSSFVFYPRLSRHYLEDTHEILWLSERDGWWHLYLIEEKTGSIKRQLTEGNWVTKRILHLDKENRRVYFIGCGQTAGEDPYLEKLYSVSLDGGEPLCLTPENAFHRLTFSPDKRYLIDKFSRVDLPPTTVLRDGKTGEILLTLNRSETHNFTEKGGKFPEVFCTKGRDGKTDIWGHIIRPISLKNGTTYPVIEYIYAGPHDSHVPKEFSFEHTGTRLAELGFIVVMIDGMGTANRSKAFHDVCWKNLKDAGFPDRIAWIKTAAKKYPELDISQVGIYGVSAGAQNTVSALLFHPEFYTVGVASCGCYDNRMDKIWWNELWMGYPIEKHYADNSCVVNAHQLKGELMLILGEIDDNVDPSSTHQVVKALIDAKKEFEYVLLPGEAHTLGGSYGEQKRRDFFVKHLLHETKERSNKTPKNL